MSVYSKIRDALYDGTVATYNTTPYSPPVIFSLGKNEPLESYVVINILTMEQTGRVVEDVLTDGRDETLPLKSHFQSFYDVTVQFTFYGSESGSLCETFHRLLTNYSEVRQSWSYLGLAPVSKTEIRFNPQRRDTKWEDSFNFDVRFSYRVHDVREVEWVEHITMTVNGGEQKTMPPIPSP